MYIPNYSIIVIYSFLVIHSIGSHVKVDGILDLMKGACFKCFLRCVILPSGCGSGICGFTGLQLRGRNGVAGSGEAQVRTDGPGAEVWGHPPGAGRPALLRQGPGPGADRPRAVRQAPEREEEVTPRADVLCPSGLALPTRTTLTLGRYSC